MEWNTLREISNNMGSAFKESILNDPEDGFSEICDECNALIINFNHIGERATLTFENKVVCCKCKGSVNETD